MENVKKTFGLMKKRRLVMPRRGKRMRVARTALRTCILRLYFIYICICICICIFGAEKSGLFVWRDISPVCKDVLWSPIWNLISTAMRLYLVNQKIYLLPQTDLSCKSKISILKIKYIYLVNQRDLSCESKIFIL